MGTPKKKYRRQRELTLPTLVEKFRLLEIGKETGMGLKLEKLPDIIEEGKQILLPLVPWLDKPIFPEAEFADRLAPVKFKKKRGVRVFESEIIDIWLERSGMWFLRFRGLDRSRTPFQEVDSQHLAKIMLKKSDGFLKRYLRKTSFLEEMPFVKNIALYNILVLHFLSELFKTVKSLIEEREKRLSLMGERLNLLHDYNQALDPLISQGKKAEMKGYSIFEEHSRGISRSTGDYFCPEALKPFWEILKNRPSDPSKYIEFVTEFSFESLEKILQRLSWIFEEIEGARSREMTTPKSLFGYNSGRLEFMEEEIKVLEKLVRSIAPAATT